MNLPLDPRHQCWWTDRRRMDVRWDARLNEWNSAGVSIAALLEPWRALPLQWWSRRYGEYDDLLLAFAAPATMSLPRTAHAGAGPLAALCGTWPTEAQIDAVCCAAFGVALTGDDDDAVALAMTAIAEQRPAPLTLLLAAHDDCFVSLWPVPALPALIQCCLRVQQFYNQRSAAPDAAAQVQELLEQHGRVELLGSDRPPYLLARSETCPAGLFRKARYVARPLDEPSY